MDDSEDFGSGRISVSLSLPPFFDFLDCCWPIDDDGVEDEPFGAGEWDLDFSLEAMAERSVGARMGDKDGDGGKEGSGFGWLDTGSGSGV